MNVLSIGNSFSEDAQRYLHAIAKSDSYPLNSVNLFIGGCSLERHYYNILENKKEYEIQYNGVNTGFYTTVEEALLNRKWDFITLQQVSQESVNFDTYEPYLSTISNYVRKMCPDSKLILHQTWAYEDGSDRLTKELGYHNHKEMLKDIVNANNIALKAVNADGIIRSGELFDLLLDSGINLIHRDTFHAKLGIGRYALGLLWYGYLTKNNICNISFSDTDEMISDNDIEIVKKSVNKILEKD